MSSLITGFIIWVIVTLIVCIPICRWIIDKTDYEYLAYFVYPLWVLVSLYLIQYI